jgi:hypothetical protein
MNWATKMPIELQFVEFSASEEIKVSALQGACMVVTVRYFGFGPGCLPAS